MPEYLKAQSRHKAQLAANWQTAFGDDAAYTDFVFDRFAGLEHTWLAIEKDEVVASVCAVPVTLGKYTGIYVYGVNTRKDKQKQGVMDGLLRFVHEAEKAEGAQFAVLIPANKPLFDYYEKFGYKTFFWRRCLLLEIRNNLWAQADFDTLTAARLSQMRSRFIDTDYVKFSQSAHAAMMQDLYTGGATTVETEGGYGVYFTTKSDILEFRELMAADNLAANRLLEAARQKSGCSSARLYLPRYSELYLGEGGEEQAYGQLCWLLEEHRLSDPYMGLMCD